MIGAACVFGGGILNDLAIKANGGFMPVFPSISYITGYVKPESFNVVKDIHVLGSSASKFKILTDYIDLGYSILSVGDVFIRVFVFLVIFYSIKKSGFSYPDSDQQIQRLAHYNGDDNNFTVKGNQLIFKISLYSRL